MASKVIFSNANTGAIADSAEGFSWTLLFFGFFVPLFRGHWTAAILLFLLTCVTGGLYQIPFAFFYNGWHMKYLRAQGFRLDEEATKTARYGA